VGLTNDEGDHAGAISAGGFQALYELLDLPDLNLSSKRWFISVMILEVAVAATAIFPPYFGIIGGGWLRHSWRECCVGIEFFAAWWGPSRTFFSASLARSLSAMMAAFSEEGVSA